MGRPIRVYNDVYQPRLFLDAGSDKVDKDLAAALESAVYQFEYLEGDSKIAEAKFSIENKAMRFLEGEFADKLSQAGLVFNFRFGYPGRLTPIRRAVLTKAKPSFPQQGMPTLELVAYDPRVTMQLATPKTWGKVSSSEVAVKLAEEWGLLTEVEDSGDRGEDSKVQPASLSDIEYLRKLAVGIGFECYVEDGVLHFHSPRLDAVPSFDFDYFSDARSTVLTFDPQVKMGPPSTNIASAKPKDGTANEAAAVRREIRLHAVHVERGAIYGGAAEARKSERMNSDPTVDENTAKKKAAAVRLKLDMKAIEASATVIGEPGLRAYTTINIFGVGTYSGRWYVKEVRHVIKAKGNDIYVCHLSLTRTNLLAVKKQKEDEKKKKDAEAEARAKGEAVNLVKVNTPTGSVYVNRPGVSSMSVGTATPVTATNYSTGDPGVPPGTVSTVIPIMSSEYTVPKSGL